MPPSAHLRWLGLPPRIALGFAATVATIAVAAGASYAALSARTSAGRHVRHTSAAQLAIEEVESALLVSHTAIEAYLAGGDRRHHAQFLRAAAMVEPAVASLRRLSDQHAEQRARVAHLARHVDAVLRDHARVRVLLDAGDLRSARALVASAPASQALERALDALDDLEADEARAHRDGEAAWNRSVVLLKVVFFAAVSVLLVLVLAGARLVRDEIRSREAEQMERERALVVQRRLMAVVSHDLRNPLNGILAAAWALSRGDGSAETARLPQRIVAAVQRMTRLIGDVLDWSRVHGGAPIPISRCEADLFDVCQRIADEQCDRDRDRIRIEREGDARAVFDPDRMAQVVGNLMSNALRHGPAGTPVRVRAIGADDEVRVEVQNEGPGIPQDAREWIFEPFRRDPAASAAGVGLGLFIARALTEAHGGGISLDSSPGRTTFVVRLPRCIPQGGAGETAADTPAPDCAALAGGLPPRISGASPSEACRSTRR